MADNNNGKLYICPTPIGNLEDITLRALRVLAEVDLIAAEDTRNSIKLLNHYEIKTHMTSYHEHNKIDKANELIDKIKSGLDIALISDAGMPGISDPGEELIKLAIDNMIEVIVLPGPSASITSLVMSGISSRSFAFEAFLPKDKKKRKIALDRIGSETRTIVMYESPHHLQSTLNELLDYIEDDRQICIVREITKKYEECLRMKLVEAVDYYKTHEPKGEFVIVISGKSFKEIEQESKEKWLEYSLDDHMKIYLDQGIDNKEAMKLVAKDRGISKREVYNKLIKK